ncbi:MAG: iron-sulfur cluster assembly scaffold protein [Promethearchaeota archaeon]
MDDAFDKFVEDLQEEVNRDVARNFSPNALDLIKHKYFTGRLDPYSTKGTSKNECGEMMTVYLEIGTGDKITNFGFVTNGCNPGKAAGSQLGFLSKGITIEAAGKISEKDLLEAIGRLPVEDGMRCALLATSALKDAIQHYLKQVKEGNS